MVNRRSTAVLLLAMAAASCGKAHNAAAGIGTPVSSKVVGFPVPSSATLRSHDNDPSSEVDGAVYVMPAGVTVTAIESWYAAQVPAGKSWNGFHECSGTAGSAGSSVQINGQKQPGARYWSDGKGTLQLTVASLGGQESVQIFYVKGGADC